MERTERENIQAFIDRLKKNGVKKVDFRCPICGFMTAIPLGELIGWIPLPCVKCGATRKQRQAFVRGGQQ